MRTKSFSDYLIEQFQKNYGGSDDGGPDAEAWWYQNLSGDNLIEYFVGYMGTFGIDVDIGNDAGSKMKSLEFIHSLL